jgi:hypothetical protein
MMEVNLDVQKFNDFLRCLSILRDICNDVEIRGGFIRQRSNDKANIFEVDLTPVILESDIIISNLKQKLDLLKCFTGQEVKIVIDNLDVSFSDKYSEIKFVNPRLDFLDNRFMPQAEFDSIFTLREEDILADVVIEKFISERMKVIAQVFNIVSFQMFFEGEFASIKASTTSKDQKATIVSKIPVNQDLECFSNLVTTPFIIDSDGNIALKIYHIQDTLCINKFSASIGQSNITIHTRSQFIEHKAAGEEEEE